ncbi:MAG: Rieske 2Fe-2S domain-containing protein [Flavobacteriales bacterium]|nr:Rieske 2Fe-2S domain-containing protein [Flavobacteriales bacterium]
MERRDFLAKACLMCGAGMVAVAAVSSLKSCKTAESAGEASAEALQVLNGKINIPVAEMASSRLKSFKIKGLSNNLLIVKNGESDYKSYLMKCTHAGAKLYADGETIICNLHGSNFNLEGKATKGPAKDPLISYPVSVNGDKLVISVS